MEGLITGPASATFEAPWEEHAQPHPVNKSLVEPLMAVAYLWASLLTWSQNREGEWLSLVVLLAVMLNSSGWSEILARMTVTTRGSQRPSPLCRINA